LALVKNKSLLGIVLMVGAMLLFPFLDAVAKHLGNEGIPVVEIVWARLTIGMIITAPLLIASEGVQALTPREPWLNMWRGILILASTMMFFGALRYQGIAETLAIYFVQPLVITALAPLLLGEHVGLRRWIAVAIGFLGVLIIIRPGFIEVNPGTFLAFGSGVGSGLSLIMSRKLASGSSAMANTFYTGLFGSAFASLAVVFFWHTPNFNQFLFFILLACIGTTGNYLTIKACQYAEISLLAPFGYTEMINAVFAGWFFFGDFPDGWTFVGVAVLVACAIYISNRERIRRQQTEVADPGRL
jgi:drug/metabolite transporter (DMT)-like permease